MKILVTGGAGFIGSFLVDELVKQGHQVKIYDNLNPQVHGIKRKPPFYLNKDAKFIDKDILDRDVLYKAIKNVDIIFHFAALVGVGQSMYQIYNYVEANSLGGAVILDILANKKHRVKKVIVASSMSIYGEGKYECRECGIVYPSLRTREQLEKKDWQMHCPDCTRELNPLPTDELKPLDPTSIYAITKRDHEEAFLAIGRAYNIPTVALRFFNVYGPRQALSNPYTGVCAIFSSRILNRNNPLIFEDGRQSRDFIHVRDVVKASILAMKKKEADFEVFNVGSGRPIGILKIAEILIKKINPQADLKPKITGKFRQGDIRHCFADITKIKKKLNFTASITFEEGIDNLITWVKKQICEDRVDVAIKELRQRGLAI